MARIFFTRCLEQHCVPYVVTKKTVFKWQDAFWLIFQQVFNKEFKQAFLDKKITTQSNGELTHMISDAATMQLVKWTSGGFGIACHN